MSDLSALADMFEIRGDLVSDLDLLTILRVRTKPLIFTARSSDYPNQPMKTGGPLDRPFACSVELRASPWAVILRRQAR